MDAGDIADAANWPDDPEALISLLINCEYLVEKSPGNYVLKNWKENQPFVYHADERSKQASEAATIGWKNRKNKGEA